MRCICSVLPLLNWCKAEYHHIACVALAEGQGCAAIGVLRPKKKARELAVCFGQRKEELADWQERSSHKVNEGENKDAATLP